jgi:hypothetical protein
MRASKLCRRSLGSLFIVPARRERQPISTESTNRDEEHDIQPRLRNIRQGNSLVRLYIRQGR